MEVTAVTCRMCPCSFLSLGNHGIGFGYLPKKGKVWGGKVWGTRYSKLGKRVLGWV